MPKDFRKTSFKDQNLSQMQQNIDEAFKQYSRLPFVDGNEIKEVALVTGANSITHKLGRVYRGYFILRKTAAGDVYEGTNDDKLNFLVLQSTANMTVDLWVF
jgi:hypothetical protein